MPRKTPHRPAALDPFSPKFSPKAYVDAGHDLNASEEGWTPFLILCFNECWKKCGECLECGADPNWDNGIATQPAVSIGANAPIWLLHIAHQHGANWNLWNSGGYTPLLLSLDEGRLDNVRFLLDHGADPNLITPLGYTAMHAAFDPVMVKTPPAKTAKAIDMLLKAGGRMDVPGRKNLTPYDLALKLARARKHAVSPNDPRLRSVGTPMPSKGAPGRTRK